MKLNSVVELPNGSVTFSGELTQVQHARLLEIALSLLYAGGAFPEAKIEYENAVEGNDTLN